MKHTVPARIAVATVAVAALAGCSYVNPITTHKNYAASDGTQLVMGEVEALNLLVITEAVDSPATMIGTLYNGGDEDANLQITFDNATVTDVMVPAGATVKLGPEADDTEVSGTSPVQPGLLATGSFAEGDVNRYSTIIPVMDGTLPEYEGIVDAIG
ncbi:hypothetical protein [Demequina globuliformis]|uniref:hypothetical protein n=1 Tax=Demequina globuliformis TaxID=676202 RepID=UPI0007847324|nr:hypothetical protein [Demequina globuliformis]